MLSIRDGHAIEDVFTQIVFLPYKPKVLIDGDWERETWTYKFKYIHRKVELYSFLSSIETVQSIVTSKEYVKGK